MWTTIYRSFMATLILTVILCGFYPLVVTGIGQLIFPEQASGGIIMRDGKPVGARLIGQGFSKAEYFHGRPSSAGDKGYDAANSSGSNLGPTNQKLFDAVKSNVEAFLKDNPTIRKGDVPTELVTGSGSGLDPHVSPEGALVQVDRVAQARKAGAEEIRALVKTHVEGPQLGIFGESVVNVLLLNLDLDSKFPLAKQTH
jgi:K+-transporting ATPase ATPase C chain